MANEEHLAILRQGVEVWNKWRKENRAIQPDLSEAQQFRTDLRGANLSKADLSEAQLWMSSLIESDLSGANLNRANLSDAYLDRANLRGADLGEANLHRADFTGADLSEADLRETNLSAASLVRADLSKASFWKSNLSQADLSNANLTAAVLFEADLCFAILRGAILRDASLRNANLTEANLSQANLVGAGLQSAMLVGTILNNAKLTGCKAYGISAWNVSLDGAQQHNLIITNWNEPTITVDNLEVAQFIYLMLNNDKVRSVLETITTKSVLILGRFSGPMKDTLDAIREKLREMDYLPIMFDFERLSGQDYTETIRVLAGMSKFVIADLSGAKSVQQELQAIIPDFELPVVPIIQQGEEIWSMFESHQRADHVLPIVEYRDTDELITNFEKVVILRAEKKYDAIIVRKARHQIEVLSVDDVLNED